MNRGVVLAHLVRDFVAITTRRVQSSVAVAVIRLRYSHVVTLNTRTTFTERNLLRTEIYCALATCPDIRNSTGNPYKPRCLSS